jgi:hypothetical protein
MVRSVRESMDCTIVQLSDLSTERVAFVDEIIRLPMKVPLMSFRIKHLSLCPYSEWVCLDTDVVVRSSLKDVWARDFDAGFTRRPPNHPVYFEGRDISHEMPFNTGVIFSRSQAFWAECYEWIRRQDDSMQNWWGDQMAVAHVGLQAKYKLLLLPEDQFNWSPSEPLEESNARIWHYKGAQRKEWMQSKFSLDSISGRLLRTTSAVSPSSIIQPSR